MKALVYISNDLIKEGVLKLLDEKTIIDETFYAYDYHSASEKLHNERYDLVVTDDSLLDYWKKKLPREKISNYLQSRLLILSSREDWECMEFIKMGARGIIPYSTSSTEFCEGVQTVLSGRIYISPELQSYVINACIIGQDKFRNKQKKSKASHNVLSKREKQVYDYLMKGVKVIKIADIMGLKVSTVSTFKANILKKSNTKSLIELVRNSERYSQLMGTQNDH